MKREITTALVMLLAVVSGIAQTPEHYPPPVPEPVAPTLFNIVLYVIIPIALLVFLIYYRCKRKKGKE